MTKVEEIEIDENDTKKKDMMNMTLEPNIRCEFVEFLRSNSIFFLYGHMWICPEQ